MDLTEPEVDASHETRQAVGQEVVSRVAVAQIGVYFFIMMLFYSLGTPGSNGIAYISILHFLKDTLHFDAKQTSIFGFITGIPLYIGFVLGYLRDRWQPLRKGDLGYLFFTPPLIAAGYLWLAFTPVSYRSLVIATLLSTAFGVLLGASIQGLMTQIAQRNAIAGRLSVVIVLTTNLPSAIGPWLGGLLTAHSTPKVTFFLAAACALVVSVTAFWQPRAIFKQPKRPAPTAVGANSFRMLGTMLRHPSLYLPAIIMFLWNFSPGWNTPLYYYFKDTVKLSDEQFGNFNAIQNVALVLFTLFYLWLCPRCRLIVLLWWGTILGVIGAPLLLLIHNMPQAVVIAILTGGTSSIALSAYYDLLMRACPKALAGAVFMLGAGMLALANQSSDVFGSWLFQRGGFALSMIATAITTGLILPILPFLPHHLTQPREGESRSLASETI